MTSAPVLSDALRQHGHRIHLAIPNVFQRGYSFAAPGAPDRSEQVFASNVAMAAANRAMAEQAAAECAARNPEAAAVWASWARFFTELQNARENRHAA